MVGIENAPVVWAQRQEGFWPPNQQHIARIRSRLLLRRLLGERGYLRYVMSGKIVGRARGGKIFVLRRDNKVLCLGFERLATHCQCSTAFGATWEDWAVTMILYLRSDVGLDRLVDFPKGRDIRYRNIIPQKPKVERELAVFVISFYVPLILSLLALCYLIIDFVFRFAFRLVA